jgi:cytochrome c oxidase cbb3-type subunit III
MPRRLFQMLLVVLACVASGSLECGRPPRSAAEVHGADVYARMCSVCHGRDGEGYKADEATALRNPAFLASASDAFLRKAIADGRKDTTMSAWGKRRGGPLSPSEVDDVIAHLRSWQREPRAELDERRNTGDVARGERIYAEQCLRCHGVKGATGPNVHLADPGLLATATNGFLRHAIRHGRSGTTMPAFAASLGDQGVEDVLALLRSWEPKVPPIEPPAVKQTPLPLGAVVVNPKGPEPRKFQAHPKRTSMEVVKPELERGARMALLDARAPSDYIASHIPGAVSVPFYDVDRYQADLPRNTWLVCYCSCPHAESGMLAAALVSKGFTKVTVLDEGLRGWNAKHYETRKGQDP